jgi:hypothetical protein
MTSVDITGKSVPGISRAVACAKYLLSMFDALDSRSIVIEANDLAEDQWSEMTSYLARRGCVVAYDYDAGLPVATLDVEGVRS